MQPAAGPAPDSSSVLSFSGSPSGGRSASVEVLPTGSTAWPTHRGRAPSPPTAHLVSDRGQCL
eukprot:6670776-Pyramimonas_sp.AAC.2